MKKFNRILLAALLLLALLFIGLPPTWAQSYTATDGYVSANVSSPTTNYTEVIFAGSPTKSIRLTAVDYESETNSAFLHYYAGTASYTVTGVINATNLVVSSNAGIVTNQRGGIRRGSQRRIPGQAHPSASVPDPVLSP